jgi:nitroreductase/NAD-dependent dihydropyrimidine dehydrogenase PreA subunit
MSLIEIDQEKCRRDGVCAAECPRRIIVMAKDAYPSVSENVEESCIKCGHCVAVCPQGALTLKDMGLEEYPAVQKDLLPRAENIRQFLLSRRSIRSYQKRPVSRELLAELIDIARHAPSGSNKQQVYWTVFEDPATVRDLGALTIDWMRLIVRQNTDETAAQRMKPLVAAWDKGEDRVLRGAPHLITVHSEPSSWTDCLIALTYLELYAFAQGLGTCWAGYLTSAANAYAPLKEALGLPQDHQCCGAVMIGYPSYQFSRIPKRNPPLVTWR